MAKNLNWETYKEQIDRLASLEYNYDEKLYHDSKDKSGWYIDKYNATIGKEQPGEPVTNGPFEKIKEVLRLYQFPDPRLIHAVFDPGISLSGRNMLMFANFAGFTFTFGVRVTAVIDEIRENQRVWGYAYRTLKGHFEIGEIRFEVMKNLTTGEISFEVDAYSKPDRIPNLFYRTGFRFFGRPLQKYFAWSSIKRLKKIAQSHR